MKNSFYKPNKTSETRINASISGGGATNSLSNKTLSQNSNFSTNIDNITVKRKLNGATMFTILFALFLLIVGVTVGATYSAFQSTATSSGTMRFETPVYTITLDNANATTNGTSTIYEKYVIGTFTNSQCTTQMTTSTNPITKPTREYTISYNSNGGSSCSNQTANYTFNGYYTLASGGVQMIGSSGYITNSFTPTYFDSNSTLHAQWTSASITLPTPTRTGYTFAGWYNESGLTNKAGDGGASYTPTNSKTLYAKWTETIYTITYNTNGGDSISAGSYTFSTSSQNKTLTTPSRTGYTFNGYTITTNTSGSNSSISDNITLTIPASAYGNITVQASWDVKTYTITLIKNGGATDSAATATYNSNLLTILAHTTRNGYNLTGYWTNASGGAKVINSDGTLVANVSGYTGANGIWLRDENVGLYAQWTAKTIILTLNQQAATTNATYTMMHYTFGTNVYYLGENGTTQWNNSSVIPIRTGYTFGGYYTSTSGGVQYITNTGEPTNNLYNSVGQNITLYARWYNQSYVISINPNEHSLKITFVLYYSPQFATQTQREISTTDSNFTAIYNETKIRNTLNPITKPGDIVGISSGAVGYKLEYLYCIIGGNNVPIMSTDGSLISNVSGYTDSLGRWIRADNATFYAQWTTTPQYNITLSTNGTGVDGNAFATYNSDLLSNLQHASKTGYTLTGYHTSPSGGDQVINYNGTLIANVSGYTDGNGRWIRTSDTTLYAYFSVNIYSISLDSNGASSVGTTMIHEKYGDGIYLERNGNTLYNPMSTNANPITTPSKTYTVTFDYNYSGSVNGSITIYGTFNGYYDANSTQMINSNGYITTNFTNITFLYNVSLIASWSGDKFTFSSTYRTGYTLTAWYYDADCTLKAGDIGTIYTPTSNITFYAKWEVNTYNITYNTNGGNSISAGSYSFSTSAQTKTLTTPSRTGYTFAGYTITTNTSGSNSTITSNTTLNIPASAYGNITVQAGWTVNPYTISYTLNSGTAGASAPTSGTYDVGLTISNPTRTGYTFNGWNISGMDNCTHYYGTSSSSYSTSTATSLSNITSTWFKNLRSTSSTVTFNAQWVLATYTITLYSSPSTTAGTTTIYEKYSTGYYTDSSCTNQMTTTTNQITVPTRTGYTFVGYYTGESGAGTQYIDSSGYITGRQSNTQFSNNGTLFAYWIDNNEGGYFQEVRVYSDTSIIRRETLYFVNSSLTISFTSRFGMRIAAISDGVKSYTYSPLNDLSSALRVIANGNQYNISANVVGSDISTPYSSWYPIEFRY